MSLAEERCEACRPDSPRVPRDSMGELLAQLPGWEVIAVTGVDRLRREFRFRDFESALAFTNAIGAIAEEEDHHPRLVTEWGSVEVSWWTHAIGGLHRNDFVMAARTDVKFQDES